MIAAACVVVSGALLQEQQRVCANIRCSSARNLTSNLTKHKHIDAEQPLDVIIYSFQTKHGYAVETAVTKRKAVKWSVSHHADNTVVPIYQILSADMLQRKLQKVLDKQTNRLLRMQPTLRKTGRGVLIQGRYVKLMPHCLRCANLCNFYSW